MAESLAQNLNELQTAYEAARRHFLATIHRLFPGMGEYHWYRALTHMRGQIGRRNDDTSHDEALAASKEIEEAHDAFIKALHAFYRARDGERGFLGGKGV